MSNSLDPDQVQHFAGPDLDPNGLHRFTAEKKMSLAGRGINTGGF